MKNKLEEMSEDYEICELEETKHKKPNFFKDIVMQLKKLNKMICIEFNNDKYVNTIPCNNNYKGGNK